MRILENTASGKIKSFLGINIFYNQSLMAHEDTAAIISRSRLLEKLIHNTKIGQNKHIKLINIGLN